MLLRRIIEHVRTQNWFAIALDFDIVVGAVFVGSQLGNGKQERLDGQEEIVLAERIKADFERIQDDADRRIAFPGRMSPDLGTMVRSLQSGELKDEEFFKGDAFAQSYYMEIILLAIGPYASAFEYGVDMHPPKVRMWLWVQRTPAPHFTTKQRCAKRPAECC